jgi:hypothetical protein
MKTRIDTHDDVALRDEETIAWWAMAHHMDDDRVPCGVSEPVQCPKEAGWSYRHDCGIEFVRCNADRILMDDACRRVRGVPDAICARCQSALPVPIPWLPM